jgi:hypothetical protein
MSSTPNPFASDPSGLRAMLQAAFAAMPQGGGQLDYMPLPQTRRPEAQMIDLGAGGPAPGSPRQNGLTALGGGLQGLSSIVGSAMAANAASETPPQGFGAGSSFGPAGPVNSSTVPLSINQSPGTGNAPQLMNIPTKRLSWGG